MTGKKVNAWAAIILIAGLFSCYGPKLAQKQFGRAAASFPEIGADYCARTFPPVPGETIPGKDSIIIDTIYFDQAADTLTTTRNDTTIRTILLTGPRITTTIRRTDTIRMENRAAWYLCDQDRRKAIQVATDQRAAADRWRGLARNRFWIIWALIAIILAYTGYRLNKLFWQFQTKH
tara:strand:+ start:507 stop:1037 length:531 start_codon:yes stop_codon:yes gene_type:complete